MSIRTTMSTAVTVALGAAVLLGPGAGQSLSSEGFLALRFVARTIDTGLRGGYQTVIADLNRDDKPDIIALALGLPDLLWYENPGWQRHVIGSGLTRMINVAAHDIDGDGVPELALAHGFATSYDQSPGVVSLLTQQGDPTKAWSIREIDRVPTAHRLRWADIDGSGSKVLVNAPLIGPGSEAPEYRDRLSLFWYRPGDWARQVVTDAEQGVVHGIHAAPWGDTGREAVLSASFLGVHAHGFDRGGWTRTPVVDGDSSAWPNSGASEVEVGHLGTERFLTTIEPWHGHQVVVYRGQPGSAPQSWPRQVIDGSIEDGHTLVVADLDGDGRDEIVAGERGGNRSVYLYRLDDGPATTWSKQVIDDGNMAAAGCAVSDLNGNGRPDVVCIGSGTANLKWYDNLGD